MKYISLVKSLKISLLIVQETCYHGKLYISWPHLFTSKIKLKWTSKVASWEEKELCERISEVEDEWKESFSPLCCEDIAFLLWHCWHFGLGTHSTVLSLCVVGYLGAFSLVSSPTQHNHNLPETLPNATGRKKTRLFVFARDCRLTFMND